MNKLTASWACAALLLTGAANAQPTATWTESNLEERPQSGAQPRGRWCEPVGSGYYECFDEHCYDDYGTQKSVCTLTTWIKEMDK